MPLKLMYVANDPIIVTAAQRAGVDRIWIDLEVDGKEERQHNMDTLKSHHSLMDIKRVAPLITTSELLVRVNPWSPKAANETDEAIKSGARIVMLPMWKTVKEVKEFIEVIAGRAKCMLLLETMEAENCLDEVLDLNGVDEIHIGLNDLHLSYGLTFLFELLSNGKVESICKKIASKGIPYGFGGIAGIGKGELPAENIIKEHYRLGSSMAILARSFCDPNYTDVDEFNNMFCTEMTRLRSYEKSVSHLSIDEYNQNKNIVREIVESIKNRKMESRANA